MEMTEETRAELLDICDALHERIDKIQEAAGQLSERRDLSDDERGNAFERVAALPLDDQLDVVLGLMKLVKMHATGRAYEMQQYASSAICATLYNLDREAMDAAFGRWFEAEELEELEEQASTPEVEKLLKRFKGGDDA
jgi:hypothetical protein